VKQSVIGRARGLFDSKLHEVKKNITVEWINIQLCRGKLS
jgi:hypothetical protein